ncbi:MAG TPA: hypothetical protein VMZ28_25500 [Kofleriaceae bacterium]|nr:hypothetical protein [Kofleriaceae bacterium]
MARRPAPAPTGDSFEEDEYLDELLGEGPKKKKAAEPVKSSEITMDAEDLGDPDARERERDLARAKAAGEAAVARMKAKLAKQGLKTYDRGPVPDAVARPKKKVAVARVEPQDDEDEEDAADEDEAEDEAPADDELDAVGDVVERPARKAEKPAKAEKPEKLEKRVAAPAPRPAAKKKSKGEFYASGEGFLAEDESSDDSAPEVVSDDDDSADTDDSDDDDAEPARPARKKAAKAKKSKKKTGRAARSTKGKSRATSKGDRRTKSSDDDEG